MLLSLLEIEELVGEPLPSDARYPSWWRNDERRMHARAWLTAGWQIEEAPAIDDRIMFVRSASQGDPPVS